MLEAEGCYRKVPVHSKVFSTRRLRQQGRACLKCPTFMTCADGVPHLLWTPLIVTFVLEVWLKVVAHMVCCAVLATESSSGPTPVGDVATAHADDREVVTGLLQESGLSGWLTEQCTAMVKTRLQHVTDQQGAAVCSDAAVERALRSIPASQQLMNGPTEGQMAQLAERMLRLLRKGPKTGGSGGSGQADKPSADPYAWYKVEMMRLGVRFGCSNPLCLAGTHSVKYQMCGGCGRAWYCSRACQAASWPRHKELCKAAAARRGQ